MINFRYSIFGRRFPVDWNEIKTEYISSDIGYRELAKKCNVSFSTLQKRAKKENWPGLKRQVCDDVVTAVTSAVTSANVDRALKLQTVADLLLEKISLTIENIDGRRSARTVKDASDALKNVRDIMGIKSEADTKEQDARIAKLRKETEPVEEKDRKLEIVGIPEEYKR